MPRKVRKAARPNWKARFLAALAASGNVTRSAAAAKVSRKTAYAGYHADPAFCAAWDDAEAQAGDYLDGVARDRALGFEDNPVLHQGAPVVVSFDGAGRVVPPGDSSVARTGVLYERRYDSALLLALLKAAKPEKFRDHRRVEVAGDPAAPLEVAFDREAKIREMIREFAADGTLDAGATR